MGNRLSGLASAPSLATHQIAKGGVRCTKTKIQHVQQNGTRKTKKDAPLRCKSITTKNVMG